jgi:peptidylprolyl isomerase/peptidyl-prolyl cis-trans isomerase B (cyclophilin B)
MLVVLVSGMGCSKQKEVPPEASKADMNKTEEPATKPAEEVKVSEEPVAKSAAVETVKKTDPHDVVAVITMEKGGEIVFEFYPDDAPKTVDNFVTLTNKGFYDGLTFHRVVPGFVVQAGCPKGDGSGGPGYKIPAEFNKRKHLEGTVAMARSQDPNSAGSQFYICLGPQQHLDGKYTVFGQTVKGMDVVKGIQIGDVMKSVRIAPKSDHK